MQFKDVIGQNSIKQRLIQAVDEDRIPHAQLFAGPPGNGKLALALAFAQYINCPDKTSLDSCGGVHLMPEICQTNPSRSPFHHSRNKNLLHF